MSTITKRPTPPNAVGRRPAATPQRTPSPSSRLPAPPSTPSVNGIRRTPSSMGNSAANRPARIVERRPDPGITSLNNTNIRGVLTDGSEEDARAENAMVLDELKHSLRKAEAASEEYQRQLSMLQTRLDDKLHEHEKFEDQLHENHQRVEVLEADRRETTRQKREMEATFESERTAMMRDRDEHILREEELQSVIQRLKETLTQRDFRGGADEDRRSSRSYLPNKTPLVEENERFAPPSQSQRTDSKDNSRMIVQKDKIIESLRLELAESHIKLLELENKEGSRMQELEKILLDTRMTNARLMEDNESFQLLLGEKTLNGDFSKAELMQGSMANNTVPSLGSLAEELELAEGESESFRRLETESKSLRDQNKALTLYIEKIISRVLQHENFETILDKTPDLFSSAPKYSESNLEKELPPPPPPKDNETPVSMLQRARSVVAGPARRPRPTSQYISSSSIPHSAVSEDSISSGRRPRPMSQVIASSRISPGISPGGTISQSSYFAAPIAARNVSTGPSTAGSISRASSGPRAPNDQTASSSNSTFSEHSGEAPSPPRNSAAFTNYTGAVMTQSRLRPLRLVQENKEMESGNQGGNIRTTIADENAQKTANRSSWMGWFNRGKEEAAPRSVSAEGVKI